MQTELRVIIIAPIGQDAAAMAGLLSDEGYEVQICRDIGDAAQQIQIGCGTLLLTEEALESNDVSHLEKILQTQASWSELPVIILTSGGESRLVRLLDMIAAAAGSVTLLERPLSARTLVRSVAVAMRSRQRQYQVRDLIQQLAQANQKLEQHAEILERTVSERTRELNETVQELEAFSYSIVHDMRSPLRAMNGFAHIVTADYGPKLDDEGRNLLNRIATSAERLDQLIQDVLHYASVVRGDIPLHPVNTKDLLKEIIAFYPSLQRADVKIEIAERLPTVYANGAALMQVFSNLLENAVKFTSPGVAPRVKVWAETVGPDDSMARFWFDDNGIGIPKESKQRIFQIFQRLNHPHEYKGTGIGLAVVFKAVKRMGGKVGVESEPNKGSRFWVELKVVHA